MGAPTVYAPACHANNRWKKKQKSEPLHQCYLAAVYDGHVFVIGRALEVAFKRKGLHRRHRVGKWYTVRMLYLYTGRRNRQCTRRFPKEAVANKRSRCRVRSGCSGHEPQPHNCAAAVHGSELQKLPVRMHLGLCRCSWWSRCVGLGPQRTQGQSDSSGCMHGVGRLNLQPEHTRHGNLFCELLPLLHCAVLRRHDIRTATHHVIGQVLSAGKPPQGLLLRRAHGGRWKLQGTLQRPC